MKTRSEGIVQAFACAALFMSPSLALADEWAEYENPATGGLTTWSAYSTDPRVESRRTDHFLIRYGHERQEGLLVEQVAVGHLQYLENCYDTWLALGFTPGLGGSGTNKFKSVLHVAKTFPGDPTGPVGATGFSEGGASGCCVPTSYLGYRDGNGATPHEFGHGWGTKLPSFFSEGVANWIEQQAIMGYPGDWPAVGITMSHAANYYNMLSIFNYFMEAPGYGAPFLMKLFYEPNLNDPPLNASLDDIIRKAIRCDTSGATDKAGAIHDGLGRMNAKMLDIDFWNKRFNNLDRGTGIRGFTYDMDLNRQGFHFNRIPMVKQPGVSGTWYRPEFSMIPQSLSQNFIPLSITATGSLRTVTCDFRPVAGAVRGTSFRACFVAFNQNKEPRYSAVWNVGEKSFILADDENSVYLAIIACPYSLNTDLLHNDYTADNVAMFPYRLSLTGATPKGWQRAAPTSGFTRHANGGGIKETTATVDASAFIGTNAMVLGTAKVYGNSRIEDYAVVDSSATIGRSGQADNPVISGHAYVTDTAQVYGHGKVRDYGWVFGSSKVYENGVVMAHSVLNGAQVFGNAVINQTSVRDPWLCYSGSISGCAIIGGDTSGGSSFDKGVYCEFPGLSVLDNAYQYLGYNFEKKSCVFAMDQYGMNHSYLMNEPQVVGDTVNGVSTKVLALDPLSSQYVEVRPDAVDFADLTISVWVKPQSLATNQMIFSFGNGSNKVMWLTARDTTALPRFEISDGSSTQALTGTAAFLTNTWTHVAVTLAGNTGTFYVGGTQVSQNVSMTIDPDQLHAALMENANYLGRGNAGGYFQGRIDEFRVYNKALSATEVAALLTSITTSAAPASDTTAPTPNAATWLVNPTVIGDNTITMSATEGTDAGGNGVLYYFRCVTDSSHDSGWISENKFTDFKCAAGTTYTYAVRMKDKNGNTGTESTQLSATAPVADTTAPTPNPPTFAFGPLGSSTTSITMTATAAIDTSETVLYKFARVGSAVNSGWTSSRTWTDMGLTPGANYSYTLQTMDGHSNSGAVFTSSSVVARDDTPPALDADFRLQWAILPHTQLDKTVRMCVVEPVETAVDYYYECVEFPSINSGWTNSRTWVTPAFTLDGTNSFRFKLRDRSPQLNQSVWSATKTAKILPSNSYHDYALSQLASLPDSTLVRFSGTVSEVATNYYIVTNATASIQVVPRSYYTATDALLLNKPVEVKGHLWTYSGTPKRVTEAFVRGNPQSGKVEFENCDYADDHWALRTDADASGLEYLGGGFPVGYSVTLPNVAATAQMTVRYRRGSGTLSLYVNGTHAQNLTLPYLSTWGKAVFTGLSISAGATLKFQRDAGDAEVDLDYVIVGPVYTVSGKVTSTAGGANISGATVYFSDVPGASANPLAATTTTDAAGNYTYTLCDGPWYVCAAKDGYNTSSDQTVVVNGGPVAGINFALLPNVTVSGKVTDKNGGANIAGASVYFAASPGGVPVFTAQTTVDGDLSQSIPNGTWYVHAGKTGYYPTFEQVVVVNGVALTGVNFQLEANPRTVPQTGSLYFHVDPDSFTAAEGAQTGNWQLQYLDGVDVSADPTKYAATGGSPSMEVRGAIKWERNKYDDMEGYEVQNRTLTPILPFNGATFVAVIKPTLRTVAMGYGGQWIVNVGYTGTKGFAIIMLNDTGQLKIRRQGTEYLTGVFIPDGQKTVLTCVVQPNGSFILYANGLQVYAQTATSSFVNVDLSAGAAFQQKVSLGTGAIWLDGAACYNGNIGDVMAYYAPLSGTDRAQLETHLMKKFTIGGITISATAGAGGSIAPSGTVVVAQGGNQTFAITPDPGYAIQSLLIDGVSSPVTNSYTFSNVLAGHTISATFASLPPPTITLTRHAGTGNSSTYGDLLSFDVTVNGNPTPTGTVTLKDGGPGGTALGSATLAGGACTITTTALTAGSHTNIVAVYGGDSSYPSGTSSALDTQTVAKATPVVTITGPTVFAYTGSPQGPDTATASGSTGSLTFQYAGSGGTSYGPSATRPTALGSYTVTATVAADDNFNSASSSPTSFTIIKATPTLSVVNSPLPYTGSPQAALVTGSVPGTVSNVRYNGSATVPSAIATYAITADFAPTDSANYNSLTGASAGNFVITPPHTTTAGTATAVASGQAGIAVTMPYTDDANSNNTYTVEYKFSSGSTWTPWVTAATHVASPYTATITGLTPGTSYDIRVTYNDADGVTGINPQIIPSVTTSSLSCSSLNNWINVSSTAPNNAGGTVNVAAQTVSVASNRLFVVAVCMEANGTPSTMSASASLGGKTLTPIGSSQTTGREFAYMGYLKESDIPSGANTLAVTYGCTGTSRTITGLHIKWGSYRDVDQASPIFDSNANYNGAANVTFGSQIDYLKGGLVFYTAANGGTVATIPTPPTDFSTIGAATDSNSGHTSFVGATTSRAASGNYASTTSVAFSGTTSTRSALVVASLRPAKAVPSLMVTNSPVTYNGSEQAAIVNSSVPGSVSNVKYNGSSTVPTAAGVYTVTADFAPTDSLSFTNQTAAAAGDFVIQKATPTLSVTNSPAPYTGTPQTALVNGSVAGSVSNVKYDGSEIAPTASGTYTVTADFMPTDATNYASLTHAPAGSFIIQKATPTLSVTNSPAPYTGTPQTALINGSVAGNVSNVKYDGSGVAPTAPGTYTVTADFQPSDMVSYNSLTNAPAGSFVIQKATPTVSVGNSPGTYNGSAQAALVNASVAGTVSNVKYNGSATVPTAAGTYEVTADFTPADMEMYNTLSDAPAGNFVIQKATPTVSVANSPAPYTGTPQTATVNGSVAGMVSNVKYNGSATAPTVSGTYTVTADFAPTDAANYNSLTDAPAGSFVIRQATPTVSVANSPVVFTGSAQAALVNGSVAGTVSNVKYDGSATAPSAAGTYAITANFEPADAASYNSLTNAPAGNFVIQKATPTVTVTNSPATYTGTVQPALVSGSVEGTVSSVKYDGSATAPSAAGTYAITASFEPADAANYNSLTNASAGSFVIQKVRPTVTVTNSPASYTGSAQPALVSGSVAGNASNVRYNDSAVVPTTPGTYTVTADFEPADTANYESLTAAPAGNFVIQGVPLTITATGPAKTYGVALDVHTNTSDFMVTGLLPGETVTGVTLTPDAAGRSPATPAGSTYVIAPSQATGSGGFSESHYQISYAHYVGTVTKATPVIEWNTPGAIPAGTPLSGAQLNATSGVAGSFVYTPPAGTVLPVGSNHTLRVRFTPSDPDNYNTPEDQQVLLAVTASTLSEDFEHEWADNDLAVTTNGWTVVGGDDLSRVVNMLEGYSTLPNGLLYPLDYDHTTRRRMLNINTQGSVLKSPTPEANFSNTKITLDMMAKFQACDSLPAVADESIQTKVAVLLLGTGPMTNLCVFHGKKEASGFGEPFYSAVTNQIMADQWCRLTLVFDSLATPGSEAEAYRVYLNGQALYSPEAYSDTWKTRLFTESYTPDGGTWFLSAARRAGSVASAPDRIGSIGFQGAGFIDDLLVTYADPRFLNFFTIMQLLGPNGWADPAGAITIAPGATTSIVYTADQWYRIAGLTNDQTIAQAEAVNARVYTNTFSQVTGDRTVHVAFKPATGAQVGLPPSVDPDWARYYYGLEASALADSSLANDYLFNVNPTVEHAIGFAIQSLTVTGSSITVTVQIRDGVNPLSTTLHGVLKLQGKNALEDPTWADISQATLPNANFDEEGRRTIPFTDTSYKFYRGVIVPE